MIIIKTKTTLYCYNLRIKCKKQEEDKEENDNLTNYWRHFDRSEIFKGIHIGKRKKELRTNQVTLLKKKKKENKNRNRRLLTQTKCKQTMTDQY